MKTKEKISFKQISYDKYDESYIDEDANYIDQKIRDIVYSTLNKKLDLDQFKVLLANNVTDMKCYEFFTSKDVEKIYNEILKTFPSIISKYKIERVQLTILFYINRFLYQIFERLNIKNRRLKKNVILHLSHKHTLKVLKEAKAYLVNQISRLITFISPNISQIYELLYKYTDIDEDNLILTCLERFICNVSYKYNPLKIKNLDAFVKLIFKRIISLILKTNINKDEEIDEVSTKYCLVSTYEEFNNFNLVNKYEFLVEILKSLTYDKEKYFVFLESYNILNENYKLFTKSLNPFRLLEFIERQSYDGSNFSLYLKMYDDFQECFNILANKNLKDTLKSKYKTLYFLLKSFTFFVGKDKNDFKININALVLKSHLTIELRSLFGSVLDEKVIETVAKEITSKTFAFMANHIFLDPINLTPITNLDKNKLIKDIVKLYISFLK